MDEVIVSYKGIKRSFRINTGTQLWPCKFRTASWISQRYRFQQTENLILRVNQHSELHLTQFLFIFFFARVQNVLNCIYASTNQVWRSWHFSSLLMQNVFCFLKSQCFLKRLCKKKSIKKTNKNSKQKNSETQNGQKEDARSHICQQYYRYHATFTKRKL